MKRGFSHVMILCFAAIIACIQMIGASWNDAPVAPEVERIGGGYTQVSTDIQTLSFLPNTWEELLVGSFLSIGTTLTGETVSVDSGSSQTQTGEDVLYASEMSSEEVLLWSRLPFILGTMAFIVYISYAVWWHTRNLAIAYLVLFFAVWSPTLLGYGRLVSTELFLTFILFICWDATVRTIYISSHKRRAKRIWFIRSILGLGIGVGIWVLVNLGLGDESYIYVLRLYSEEGFWWYYPVVYALKTPLAFVLAVLTSLIFGCASGVIFFRNNRLQIRSMYASVTYLIAKYPWEVGLAVFGIGYSLFLIGVVPLSGMSLLMPLLPIIWIFVAKTMVLHPLWRYVPYTLLGILGIGYVASSVLNYPSYIAYANLMVGETYRYQAFSGPNLDRGQDLKRLSQWTETHKVDTIHLDYYGSVNPEYYLGDTYTPLDVQDGPQKGYVAVSATQLQKYQSRKDIAQSHDGYWWLYWRTPDAQIGHSILIYRVTQY